MRTSARPPIDAACGPANGRSPSSPRRSGGCAGCIRLRSPPLPRWVVVRLIQGHVLRLILCRVGPLDHDSLDRRRQELLLERRSPQRSPPPAVHRRHRSAGSSWCPFFPGRWDSCPSFPPRTGPCPASRRPAATPTAPRRVRHTRRPRPPRSARRSLLRPTLEPVVDSALGSEPLGQLVPLAAAAHPEDDPIQHFPPIGDLPPSGFLGPELQEDRLDPLP